MINVLTLLKSFFQHVFFDEAMNLGKDILMGAASAGKDKGIEMIKSLPFGLGLDDEEAYFAAERYAREHLEVTPAMIDKYHGYQQPLTDHQKNEIRLLISRRCQELTLKGPHGKDEKRIVNPDGGYLIRDLARCPDYQHFIELLERAGADKNLIDTVRNKYSSIINSPSLRASLAQAGQLRNNINNWFVTN